MTSRSQESESILTTTSSTNPSFSIEMIENATQTTQVLQNVSLEVPLMKNEQLYPTPSMKDKIQYDVEFDLRLTGCELIQTAGRLLKLPQTAMATGQVLFHRFYYSKSFVKNPMEYYAMAAIFLSTKIEECPRRVRDVLNVFHHIKQVRSGKIIKPMPIDENYHNAKNQVIKAERRLLKELGFCVHVKHPHKIILVYLQAMKCNQENLSQKAWNYMNDGLRIDIFLRYSPEIIACACIYLSARELGIPLPENPPWYLIFGADEESIKTICIRILHLYTHKTRPLDELERIINDCRDRIDSERKKAKEVSGILEPEPEKPETVNPEQIKKTAEQIKKISASIAKSQSKASPNVEPGHAHHSHHMTRHSSFNYNYYGHPGVYMDPYYGGYEHGYYGEMVYDTNLKRNKSASYLLPPHHKDYNYEYKKYPSDKSRSKDYRSVSRSRSRSRSKRPDKKSSRHRSRSRTADSIEDGQKNSKSPSRHKKKKSRHHKESRDDRRRDKSRDRKERERGRSREGNHHRSSKHGKDKHENSDSRYIPICS